MYRDETALNREQTRKDRSDKSRYLFAEMYLEEPSRARGITCSVCTFRGIPTIDDW